MSSPKKIIAPFIITGMIGGFILFLVWAALQAKNFGPRITDPDYYSKGLRYNTTLVEKRAASVLGWTLQSAITDNRLEINLRDKDQQPVPNAVGLLFLYLHNDAKSLPTPLQELAPGVYIGPLPPGFQGELRARVEFNVNGARLNRDLLLNL